MAEEEYICLIRMSVMKRIILVAAVMLCTVGGFAQTGTWSGTLDVQGTKLSLVFHLDGEKPVMDSPDQGAYGIPVAVDRGIAGKVTITVPSIMASYEGLWLIDRIAGTFTQMGQSFPLTLIPGEEKPSRPQTPQGPFPYSTEEVSFSNADVTLSGTLVLPEGCSKQTPVLLLVTGSGKQNRDEEIFDHRPFAVIADALARAGIASLRYDDRGAGESTGDYAGATIDDFKADAFSGVEFLRDRFDKVGVLGHSEGGTIALMLASEGCADYVVSLAGMVVSGTETLLWQNRVALAAAGYPQLVIDTYCATIGEAYDVILQGGRMPRADELDLPDELKTNYLAVLNLLQSPYIKRFLSVDMRPLLGSVACPVLAFNGTLDNQVDHVSNLEALREGLPQDPRNLIMPVEGVNHLFQHCRTGVVAEYREISETFDPETIELMIRWLSEL